ncbi:MAG TPA: polysaccharide deacetylase family protein [Anaerolineales bacterium]
MKLRSLWIFLVLALSACNTVPERTSTPTETPLPPTETATLTPSVTPTPEPSLTPTPTWVPQGPDHVLVPIFMYHHIAVSPTGSRYYVPPDVFESHLKLLHDWGYSTIPTALLVDAITKGVALPPRPIIITFDDANEDNYTNAFPIMQKYGFTGVLYVPFAYIGVPKYLTVDQIHEMAGAGWEVGSHTINHPTNFLAEAPEVMRTEIVGSRKKLADLLGLPILTFAYPFGLNSNAAVDYVHFAGYIAGMGATGYTADQGKSNLFVLQRVEIRGSEDARTITRFLPWAGDPSFLPPFTPTATLRPTRTPIPTYTQYPVSTPVVTTAP